MGSRKFPIASLELLERRLNFSGEAVVALGGIDREPPTASRFLRYNLADPLKTPVYFLSLHRELPRELQD